MWNQRLSYRLRNHLKKVYISVASASFVTAVGVVAYCNGYNSFWCSVFGIIIGFIPVAIIPRNHDGSNDLFRFTCLMLFTLCLGNLIGPTIKGAWDIDPSQVISATMYTIVIFSCFTLSAIFAPEGKYLVLGAPLLSIFSIMVLAELMNQIRESPSVAYKQTILGPLVGSIFILYSTQNMIVKFLQNDHDFIYHALLIFYDLISLFKEILNLIVAKTENQQGKR